MASGNFDPESNVGVDAVGVFFFNSSLPGSTSWEDGGKDYLPIHFTTAAARDACAAALMAAAPGPARRAVISNYLDHTVGGNWGSMGTAL
jgi:hypothetical protein